jgi:hypothetical protein
MALSQLDCDGSGSGGLLHGERRAKCLRNPDRCLRHALLSPCAAFVIPRARVRQAKMECNSILGMGGLEFVPGHAKALSDFGEILSAAGADPA